MLPFADSVKSYSFYIVGSSHSGRASFIKAVCDEFSLGGHELRREQERPENIHKNIDGVFMNFGRLRVSQEAIFYLFSGAYSDSGKFKSFWQLCDETCAGFVVMLDSTRPETFNATDNIIYDINRYTSLTYVIAVNKQDLPDAWDAETIRMVFRIPQEIPVVPCSTYDNKSAASVLIALCEELLKGIDSEAEA